MSGTLVTIKPDGTSDQKRWEQKGQPPLKMLQEAVGGYIESIRLRYRMKECVAYVDEDGNLKALPFNRSATMMFGARLCGNCAIWVPDSQEQHHVHKA